MRPGSSAAHVLCCRGKPPMPAHLQSLRIHRSLTTAAAAAAAASTTLTCSSFFSLTILHHPTRCLSQKANRWVGKLRYGAADAPSLGSWENAYEDNAMGTRKLYCKALVYASGGSRLARDWIAGCAALTSPDPSLIYTALQHMATEADVEELREHILQRLLAREQEQDGHHGQQQRFQQPPQQRLQENEEISDGVARQRSMRRGEKSGNEVYTATAFGIEESAVVEERKVLPSGEAAKVSPVAAGASNSTDKTATATSKGEEPTNGDGDDDDDDSADALISPESIRDAEHFLLSRAAEIRCFVYDAMTASLFHSNHDLRTVEVARRHIFAIGANVFGISLEELTLLWRIVVAELLLKKEKIKVLGQPWGE